MPYENISLFFIGLRISGWALTSESVFWKSAHLFTDIPDLLVLVSY